MERLIVRERSVIPACDVESIEAYKRLVEETYNIDGIGGYKIGSILGLVYGLPKIVKIAREYTDKPIIYDHQKAGTDIPKLGKKFVKVAKDAGVDAIIIFPQSGPETEKAWIEAARDAELGVIVGGLMTHPGYTDEEGGWIRKDKIIKIYTLAAELGVRDFVVPGNRPYEIKMIRKALEEMGIEPTFYAPGFIAQGGKITEAAKVAGKRWHAIVGRAIYQAKDPREAALKLTKLLYGSARI